MREIKVSGIIVECRGKILLLKRQLNDSQSGKWCLPGGSVEENETYEDAAKRELKEETGLEVNDLEEIGFHNYDEPKLYINYMVFRVSFRDRPVIVLSDEHSEYLWVSYDAALHMDNLIFKESFDKLILKLKN